ncbi:MAG: SDR family NAD(P)-dependent oxidoreductase [Kofleriaceae bacterium]
MADRRGREAFVSFSSKADAIQPLFYARAGAYGDRMSKQTKVWMITGASAGFGQALAEEVIARGERVVVAARTAAALEALVARAPDRVLAVRMDVTRGDDITAGVAAARARFGDIDVLINNAGYSMVGAVEETSEAELRTLMETMFFGPVALTREVLPRMRERKAGTIVQITSVAALGTAAGFGPYCAAKHALEGLSECLAKEVAPLGIRVLLVEPGAFRTSLFGAAFRAMPPLDAYADSVGPTRAFAETSAGKQPGDPRKAAIAIADAVDAGVPTLRLPLGTDAVTMIRGKLAEVAADVSANERVATAQDF